MVIYCKGKSSQYYYGRGIANNRLITGINSAIRVINDEDPKEKGAEGHKPSSIAAPGNNSVRRAESDAIISARRKSVALLPTAH